MRGILNRGFALTPPQPISQLDGQPKFKKRPLNRGFSYIGCILYRVPTSNQPLFFKKKFLSHSIGQNKRLPLIATITLFILSLCGSAALLSTEETPIFHTDHLYFAVVSFTTLGFGDLYPNTEGNIFRLIGIICLLSVGIIAMGVWFQLVKNWLQKIFCYKKRRFRHARNIKANSFITFERGTKYRPT